MNISIWFIRTENNGICLAKGKYTLEEACFENNIVIDNVLSAKKLPVKHILDALKYLNEWDSVEKINKILEVA